MENNEGNRSRILPVRITPEEYDHLEKHYKRTRFRSLSEYIRCVLFEKPVVVMYRDSSMDEALEEMVVMRRELNAIGNNLNQVVRNMNSQHGKADSKLWLNLISIITGKLDPAIVGIKESMNKFSDLWSLRSRAERD